MSGSTAESVHQANLATFRSYRQTIDELYNKPYTFLGDHASLVKRIQDWRKAVSHLTVWVTDDRAYYPQARPEIVNLLEAVFDSVRAVDQIRTAKGETNWIRASEKEFEGLLLDYIKLIEIAFPPHRQSRFNTPADVDALNRGKVLYNGLYSFKRRLEEVQGETPRRGSTSQPASPAVTTPVLTQHSRMAPRPNTQGNFRPSLSDGASSIPTPYPHAGDYMRKSSLPGGSMVPAQPGMAIHHPLTQPYGSIVAQPPHPISQAPTIAWNQPMVQTAPTSLPAPQPLTNVANVPPPVTNPTSDSTPNAQAPVMVASPKEEDSWDVDFDELERLDLSEWETTATGDEANKEDAANPDGPAMADTTLANGTDTVAQPTSEPPSGVASAPVPSHTPPVERAGDRRPAEGTGDRPLEGIPSSQPPPLEAPVVPKVEAEYSATQLLRTPPLAPRTKSLEAQERRRSQLAADVIDIDELSDDEAEAGAPPSTAPLPSGLESSTPTEDIINIHDSDEEMEVDELDPSEPSEANGESGHADQDQALESPGQGNPPAAQTPQSSATPAQPPLTPAQQLIKDVDALPPEVRSRIRQVAKGPMILHYLAIEPTMTRDAAEEKFDKMSDQTVFNVYVRTQSARRIIDHFKNTLNQAGHKLLLPHIDIQETPPAPPVLLRSVPGTARLAQDTIEFTISADIMASLERWRARFVTPAGSHGELVSVELACYSKDAFYSPQGEGQRELTPNAQTRTWPDGGILWAFVNNEFRDKDSDREVRLFLSPPPFVEPSQSVDISDFIREGKNTVKFVHLGGMEHFVFAVQTRRMPPPQTTWPGLLKRVQPLDPSNSGYLGLLNRLNAMIEQK